MAMKRSPTPALARLKQAIKDLDKKEAQIGWFSSAKYEDGTPVAYVASIQENGAAARSIPARPFFKPTQERQRGPWADLMKQGVKGIVAGNGNAHSVLEALALQAAGDVRETIASIQSPPLSLITLLARKHRKNRGKAGYKPVTGKTIGQFAKQSKEPDVDVTGVSTKPLVDQRIMLNTLTSIVKDK